MRTNYKNYNHVNYLTGKSLLTQANLNRPAVNDSDQMRNEIMNYNLTGKVKIF